MASKANVAFDSPFIATYMPIWLQSKNPIYLIKADT